MAVVASKATNGPGIRTLSRGHSNRMTRVTPATRTAERLTLSRWWAYSPHLPRNSAGSGPMSSPSRSLTWLEKMISAMPLVNPVTTGYGMNLIAPPRRARPKPTRMTPPIIVATMSPSTP